MDVYVSHNEINWSYIYEYCSQVVLSRCFSLIERYWEFVMETFASQSIPHDAYKEAYLKPLSLQKQLLHR